MNNPCHTTRKPISPFGRVFQEGRFWEERIEALRKRIPSSASGKTPCFLYDEYEAQWWYRRFFDAFDVHEVSPHVSYAVKANGYPGLLASLAREGASFDVSSPGEFHAAKKAGGTSFVYTGPGKRLSDLQDILTASQVDVLVHLESDIEVSRIREVAKRRKKQLRCGVRINPTSQRGWRKFGFPLERLGAVFRELSRSPLLIGEAIHFHMSYARSSAPYLVALRELCAAAKRTLSPRVRAQIKLVDIGGGFTPESFEADYAWNPRGVLLLEQKGILDRILNDTLPKRFTVHYVEPIEEIAASICELFNTEVRDLFPNASLGLEPGRYVSHATMHALLTVVDQKDARSVILDGGWNMVGWEKYQYLSYVPLINLTHFNLRKELRRLVYGSLCLPDDLWGYYVYGLKLRIGDTLVVPFQGAYTFTYAQSFIRGLPAVIDLQSK